MTDSLIIALDARLIGSRNTGDSAYWQGLVRGLSRIDHSARVLLLSNQPAPDRVPDDPRFEWVEVPGEGRMWSLKAFPAAAEAAGAQVVHTQYTLSPHVKRGGITTVHDVSFFVGPKWFKFKDRLLLRWTVPASCKRAAAVLTVSETSKREIEQYIPAARGKVHVTYNALGENIQPMPDEDAAARRQALGVPEQYVLTVGTRWPRKNMELAVAAAIQAGVPIVVTGQPGWGDERPGAIRTGYVSDEDLTALYQGASIYLAPSRHEGFGIPLLEAWACDCPVLCSAGGALPEVAQDAAIVEPSDDPTVWANRIRELLDDPQRQLELMERGRERLQDFDWRDTALQTLAIYQEVAKSGR